METSYIHAHGAISAICTPLLRIQQAAEEDQTVFFVYLGIVCEIAGHGWMKEEVEHRTQKTVACLYPHNCSFT